MGVSPVVGELLEAVQFCVDTSLDDSAREIVAARHLLDPFYLFEECGGDAEEYVGEPIYDLLRPMLVCRSCWLEQYVEYSLALRAGVSGQVIADDALNFINFETGADAMDAEELTYGIPIRPWGLELYDSDGYPDEPDILEALSWFGIHLVDGDMEGVDEAHRIADRLTDSLAQHGDPFYRRKLWALVAWLFGMSGNTLLDYGHLGIDENVDYSYREWAPDNVCWIKVVQTDADEIYKDARTMLTLLLEDESLRRLLIFNIERAKQNGVTRFYWSRRIANRRSDQTLVHAGILSAVCDSSKANRQRGDDGISYKSVPIGYIPRRESRILNRTHPSRRVVCRAERSTTYRRWIPKGTSYGHLAGRLGRASENPTAGACHAAFMDKRWFSILPDVCC